MYVVQDKSQRIKKNCNGQQSNGQHGGHKRTGNYKSKNTYKMTIIDNMYYTSGSTCEGGLRLRFHPSHEFSHMEQNSGLQFKESKKEALNPKSGKF